MIEGKEILKITFFLMENSKFNRSKMEERRQESREKIV